MKIENIPDDVILDVIRNNPHYTNGNRVQEIAEGWTRTLMCGFHFREVPVSGPESSIIFPAPDGAQCEVCKAGSRSAARHIRAIEIFG